MPGTHWLTVHGNHFYRDLRDSKIYLEDRAGIYPDIQLLRNDFPRACSLSYFSLAELKLPHASPTPAIFQAAFDAGARRVPYSIALRALVEHPTAFKSSLLKKLFGRAIPFESCILGVEPIRKQGSEYVIELSEGHFRFRPAGPDIDWPDYEYWVFAD